MRPRDGSHTHSSNRRSTKLTAWILLATAGISAVLLAGCGAQSDSATSGNSAAIAAQLPGSLQPAGEPAAGATVVTVGMYGVNAYDLDTAANTFYLTGYMWLRWAGDADPVSTLEFANAVEDWGLMVTPQGKAADLGNDVHLQQLRVQGRFFQPYDLRNYPLDTQQLSVLIEDSENTADKVVYVADTAQSGFDSKFNIPGWKLKGLTAQPFVHDYGTAFGYPETASAVKYSALQFSLSIERGRNMFFWKLLLPLLLVLVTSWLALVLHPRFVDVRTAMPATALLTTVFLQQSSLDAIPQVSTLVLMDLLYVIAYFCIVITFAQVIWDNRRVDLDTEASVRHVQKVDHLSLLVQVSATLVVVAWLILSRW